MEAAQVNAARQFSMLKAPGRPAATGISPQGVDAVKPIPSLDAVSLRIFTSASFARP